MPKRVRTETQVQEAKLFVALGCVYLQDNDNIILSLGRSDMSLGDYKDFLTPDDTFGVYVRGYLTQGTAKPLPDPAHANFRTLDHNAAFVAVNWITAHMFLGRGDYGEAVRLTERAASTIQRVGKRIFEAAMELAQVLGIEETALQADRAAEAALVEEHPLKVLIPRLPYDIEFGWFHPRNKVQTVQDKDERRVAFEAAVLEVFSSRICIANEDWAAVDEIRLSATGLRKPFEDMTDDERRTSGTVMLKDIVEDLQAGECEAAVLKSLMGARALDRAAAELRQAVNAFT